MLWASVIFIACHGGSADHFVTFAEELQKEGTRVEFYASGHVIDKASSLRNLGIEVVEFSTEDPQAAEHIALSCAQKTRVVFTDVGHLFAFTLQETLREKAPGVLRVAYYDNPEPFVPGGYSTTARKVMQAAQKVVFANSHLTESYEIEVPFEHRVGLGYYPVIRAHVLREQRKTQQEAVRKELFAQHGIEDTGQKIVVYFGGNNEEYFEKAFPHFLNLMPSLDTSSYLFLLQQHPGAKHHNRDAAQITNTPLLLSTWPSDRVQLVADVALYYQTSMGPLLALAGIPTIQTGHATYEDVLVRGGLAPSATTAATLALALSEATPPENETLVLDSLGLRADWLEVLKNLLTCQ